MLHTANCPLLRLAVTIPPASPSSPKESTSNNSGAQDDHPSLTRQKETFDISAMDERETFSEAKWLKPSAAWKILETLNRFLTLYEFVKSLLHHH